MLLIDARIFVSAADRNEPRHSDCATLLRNRSDLAVTASVIPEAAWLIETRLGAPPPKRDSSLWSPGGSHLTRLAAGQE